MWVWLLLVALSWTTSRLACSNPETNPGVANAKSVARHADEFFMRRGPYDKRSGWP